MKNNKIYFFFLLSLFLISCNGNDPQDDDSDLKKELQSDTINEEKKKPFEILFEETAFKDEYSLSLLRELGEGVCDPSQKDLENYIKPACNPKFFKLMPFKEETPMKDAFILAIKSRVHGFPIRRAFIYQRENGQLIKVNGFAANLIDIRKSDNNYKNLVLRFADEFQNHFNCLYTWRNNHYEFEKVEEINDSPIKKQFQDSMNIEIQKLIELNGMQRL